MSIKTMNMALVTLLTGLAFTVSATAQTVAPTPAPKAAIKPAMRALIVPEASLPYLPPAPLPYNAVRDTPAAPIPYKAAPVEVAQSVDMIDETLAQKLNTSGQALGPVGVAKTDGAFEARLGMARRLLEVDGTEAIVRHFVNEVHMRLIITEVGKYVDLNALSESDRYRMATIAAVAATELGDKIITLNARIHAQNMTGDELTHLTQLNDTDAQRKLTQMRIDDTGELDKNAELIMQIAVLKIVQEFEKP